MKHYTINIHTQQGTIAYNVAVPADIDLTELLLSDEPVALETVDGSTLETVDGSTLIVQCINAVAIEIAHTPPPQKN